MHPRKTWTYLTLASVAAKTSASERHLCAFHASSWSMLTYLVTRNELRLCVLAYLFYFEAIEGILAEFRWLSSLAGEMLPTC